MARQQGWFAFILSLAISAATVCLSFPFQLGLDLQGGSQLTLEVQPTKEISRITADQLEAVKTVLDKRVNGLGVSESILRTMGDDQLVLELPGEQNPERAAKVLGQTALLEFRAQKPGTEEKMKSLKSIRRQAKAILDYRSSLQKDNKDISQSIFNKEEIIKIEKSLGLKVDSDNTIDQLEDVLDKVNLDVVSLFETSSLTGKDLLSAGRQQEANTSGWEVTLSFSQEGAEKFADLTKSIAGTNRLLGIVLDGSSISEASVGAQFKTAGITGGAATISGNFSAEDARDLEVQLRGGALPLPVNILQIRTIGPSLGLENIKRSLVAALSGLLMVALFMLLIYRLPGLVAVVSLSLYALFNLSIYTLLPVTLTLPGIAGFVLSIGMAVDANVLIFERIKDELRRGNTLIRSIETGFSQAFSSIIDGHLTTLISCTALFFLGIGLVKGFAATLGIGVFISLFTALSCTKTILKFLMGYQSLRRSVNFIPLKQLPSSSIV